jgi:hypothetical protein
MKKNSFELKPLPSKYNFNVLPTEIQSQIANDISDPKTMLVNKQFYQYGKDNYCKNFKPTETQIINYMNKADRYQIPYVCFEVKAVDDDHYLKIITVKNFNVDTIITAGYTYDNQLEYIYNTRPFKIAPFFARHSHYNLDLFSLYQLCLDYCGSRYAKQYIKKILDNVIYYIDLWYDDYNIARETAYNAIVNNYIYLTASALLLNIWNDNVLFNPNTDENSLIPDNDDRIVELRVLIQAFYKYFGL